jgi:hypothetical protein
MPDDVRINEREFETARLEWQQKALYIAAETGAEIARGIAPVRSTPGPYGPKSAYYGDPPGGLRDSIRGRGPFINIEGPVADFGTFGYYRALARWRGAKFPQTTAYFREGRPRGMTLYLERALTQLGAVLRGMWGG